MTPWQSRLTQKLAQRRDQGLWRQRPLVTSHPTATRIQVNGQWMLNFASNDYLGLASDTRMAEEAFKLNQSAGSAGSTASHLLAGHHLPHHLLEDELADWLGVERAILFSSGYLANLAVQTALLSAEDWVIHDKLNHASLIDGAQLASANFKRYPHLDMAGLERRLEQQASGLNMIVSDGVFSMDGDQAPLASIAHLAQVHQSLLVIDEAHAFGVLGRAGKGTFDHQGVTITDNLLRVGTLGKAFASSGAFIAGSQLLIDAIMQFARPYIYTTAQPPYQASFSRIALQRIIGGEDKRAHLQTLIAFFQQEARIAGLPTMVSETPIQPLLIGCSEQVMRWQMNLWNQGIWVPAIRPPTVPIGSARLRISLSAGHSLADIERLLSALSQCQKEQLTVA